MPKRPKPTAKVPPSTATVSLGATRPLFSPDDVHAIAGKVGLPIQRDAALLAQRWSQAFFAANQYARRDGYPAAPSDLRDFYKGVDEAAVALLRALGFAGNAATVTAECAALGETAPPAIAHLLAAMSREGLRRDPGFLHLAFDLAKHMPEGPPKHQSPVDVFAQNSGEYRRIWLAAESTHFAVALVALLARANRIQMLNEQKVSGRRRDHFKRELFRQLAEEFAFAFDYAPQTGSDRAQGDQDSTVWVCEVVKIAADRVAGSIHCDVPDAAERLRLGKGHPLAVAITKTHRLSQVTKADLLAEGQKAARQVAAPSGEEWV